MSYIKIERIANGFEVCMKDPEIEKQNAKSSGPWRDPEIEYAFDTEEKALAFLAKALKKLTSGGEYETAFSKAMMEEEEDDD